jgi:hypothetical protein
VEQLRRDRMDSRPNGFRDGEIRCASRPIDTGRSQDGMRQRILGTGGCHHVTICVGSRGRKDMPLALTLSDCLEC